MIHLKNQSFILSGKPNTFSGNFVLNLLTYPL